MSMPVVVDEEKRSGDKFARRSEVARCLRRQLTSGIGGKATSGARRVVFSMRHTIRKMVIQTTTLRQRD